MDPDTPPPPTTTPSPLAYTLSFLLVGLSWGFTTPFIRRAAKTYNPPPHSSTSPSQTPSYLKRKLLTAFYTVTDLLKCPAYLVPLIVNLTGSVWFFLLVGKAELSLTVPITNSLAFLFTVLGEWWVEGKGIGRETWIGMLLVLGGIGLCVHSKNT